MKTNRTRDQWASIRPDAFLEGSIQQARNVIEMMQQDIARLYRTMDATLALLDNEGSVRQEPEAALSKAKARLRNALTQEG